MSKHDKKIKEVSEFVERINKTFNIKINSDLKNTSVIWFRHYIIDKYKDEVIEICSVALKKHHTSILYVRNELPKLKLKSEFIDIAKIIEINDVELYKNFLEKHSRKRYDKKPIQLEHETKVKKLQMPTGEAMKLLRKNQKSLLWNKKISDWNYSDWQELKTY